MKIRVVNDSKEIAAMVYLTTIAVLESLILGLVLPGNHTSIVLSAGHLVLAASAIVGLTFIPKVLCTGILTCTAENQLFIIDDISLARSKRRESVYYQ